MKWLNMLSHWDTFMKNNFKTVRNRCRKGIPRSVRGRAWYYLCGAVYLHKKNPDHFKNLLDQEGKPECIEDIRKDLHRQFPWHEIFMEEGHGQKDLFRVLKAYSILNEKDGYCQAQAPIAATLLMHMPAGKTELFFISKWKQDFLIDFFGLIFILQLKLQRKHFGVWWLFATSI